MYTEEQFQDKLQELKAIGEEMQVQDNRATDHPLFVIEVKRKIYTDKYLSDESERKDGDHLEEDQLCDPCRSLLEKDEDLPEKCDDCSDDAFFHFTFTEEMDMYHGVFLTSKECDEYIEGKSYRWQSYEKPRSFAISANPSEEMVKVLDFLNNIPDGK